MSDLISRQDAIDVVDAVWSVTGDKNVAKVWDQIKDLPSAQPEQRWIPCSERLPDHPENDDYYLVTIQCEHYDGWDDYVTGFAEWTKHGWEELSCYIGQIKVVAWMPLPEPYKGGEPMDDLISRQAAIDAIRKGYPDAINSDYKDGLRIGTDRAIYHVEQLPSAQPEIIYCGECKHMMPNGKCRQFADSTIRPSASDFCSAGERKDNG